MSKAGLDVAKALLEREAKRIAEESEGRGLTREELGKAVDIATTLTRVESARMSAVFAGLRCATPVDLKELLELVAGGEKPDDDVP